MPYTADRPRTSDASAGRFSAIDEHADCIRLRRFSIVKLAQAQCERRPASNRRFHRQ